jgi:hypothetical protein
MSESELVRDLVQEGIQQAMQLEALKNIRFLINTAWFAIIITPVVLALILWRVWLIGPPRWRGISFRFPLPVAAAAKLLSKDEARRIATNVAKLTLMAATATSS